MKTQGVSIVRSPGGEITTVFPIEDGSKPTAGEAKYGFKDPRELDHILNLLNKGDVYGATYVLDDRGSNVTPRYGIVRRPHVGDKVSYTFNGDTYPCGVVTRVSTGPVFRRIETVDQLKQPGLRSLKLEKHVFYRRGASGNWVKQGGTWSLTEGWTFELSPEH